MSGGKIFKTSIYLSVRTVRTGLTLCLYPYKVYTDILIYTVNIVRQYKLIPIDTYQSNNQYISMGRYLKPWVEVP